MTTPQLEALLIDQTLGELPEEIDALLTAYLDASPARHEEVRAIRESLRESLQLTGEVLVSCPELFAPAAPVPPAAGWLPVRARPWLKIAGVLFALALAAGAGYRTGSEAAGELSEAIAEKAVPATLSESPWARYAVAADGRLAVVSSAQPGS